NCGASDLAVAGTPVQHEFAKPAPDRPPRPRVFHRGIPGPGQAAPANRADRPDQFSPQPRIGRALQPRLPCYSALRPLAPQPDNSIAPTFDPVSLRESDRPEKDLSLPATPLDSWIWADRRCRCKSGPN